MIEMHYHLLFGVDDGPKDLEDSLALAAAAIQDGVTHIVCTPHANDRYRFQPEINKERWAILNGHLNGSLTLGLGCEFYMSYENIEDALHNPVKYSINGLQYLLVELPNLFNFQSMSVWLRQLSSQGLVPIIAHPERDPRLASEPSRVDEWIEIGCLIQITAGAISGRFGHRAEAFCNDLIRSNRVHFVASDAHGTESRRPAMSKAFETLRSRFGDDVAQRLCVHNPRAVFFGETLPPRPDAAIFRDNANSERNVIAKLFRR
jgi:protein-tyrosine phosphatase